MGAHYVSYQTVAPGVLAHNVLFSYMLRAQPNQRVEVISTNPRAESM